MYFQAFHNNSETILYESETMSVKEVTKNDKHVIMTEIYTPNG